MYSLFFYTFFIFTLSSCPLIAQPVAAQRPQPTPSAWSSAEYVQIRSINDRDDDDTTEQITEPETEPVEPEQSKQSEQHEAVEEVDIEEPSPEEVASFLASLQQVFGAFGDDDY